MRQLHVRKFSINLHAKIGETTDRRTVKSISLCGDQIEREVDCKPSPMQSHVLVCVFLAELAGALLHMCSNIITFDLYIQ